jgi:hypothetical protein
VKAAAPSVRPGWGLYIPAFNADVCVVTFDCLHLPMIMAVFGWAFIQGSRKKDLDAGAEGAAAAAGCGDAGRRRAVLGRNGEWWLAELGRYGKARDDVCFSVLCRVASPWWSRRPECNGFEMQRLWFCNER